MTPWLATTTFYGNWLPGDPRGSVTSVRDRRPGDPETTHRIEHDFPGTEYEPEMAALNAFAQGAMKGPPVHLDLSQAEQLLDQFQETARTRQWKLHAVSIMFNHMHWVVEVHPRFGKKEILQVFKAWGSNKLNGHFGKRESDTWWTRGGSCKAATRLPSAIFYTLHRQPHPLVVWSAARGRIDPSESHPEFAYPGETWDDRVPFISILRQ